MRISRKQSFTLIEIVVCIVLASFLLTGLFNVLRQALQKNVAVKNVKQKVLQLELFQQRVKNIMGNLGDMTRLAVDTHPEASGPVLTASYKNPADPDLEMCGQLRTMLYLNGKNELCLASWNSTGKGRMEVLLDHVASFKCKIYDPRKKEWGQGGAVTPARRRESFPMIAIDLEWDGKEIPFVFFPQNNIEPVYYNPP